MSDADPPRRSAVGYRRPPKEHQFTKGVSGNPKGRPKLKPAEKPKEVLAFSAQRANQLLIEEAYRNVTVREGERFITMPLLQAVYRSLGVQALKGSRFAQKMIADRVREVESADRENRVDYVQTMMEYKSDWEARIDEAQRLGQRVPDPLPHPDDIKIDFVRGDVTVCGPKTKEEKAEWGRILARRDDLQAIVSDMARQHKHDAPAGKRALYLKVWKDTQLQYDKINDDLPRRYRRKLNDRCWEDGASRPGSQKTADWPGDS
jgi:hypothetical protein